MRRKNAVVAGLLLALALSGCAATEAQPRAFEGTGMTMPAGTKMSSAQRKQLAQSSISFDDYMAAYRRYVACLNAAGFTLLEQPMKNQLVQDGVPDAAVQSGVDEKCYMGEFQWVASVWSTSREDTSD